MKQLLFSTKESWGWEKQDLISKATTAAKVEAKRVPSVIGCYGCGWGVTLYFVPNRFIGFLVAKYLKRAAKFQDELNIYLLQK